MYRSIAVWRDLEDGHLYRNGDAFPHDGRKISDERIAELSKAQNKAGFVLIECVRDAEPVKTARKRKKAE